MTQLLQAESFVSSCYAGTGLYYRGDSAGSDVCVRDCDPASKFIYSSQLAVVFISTMQSNILLLAHCSQAATEHVAASSKRLGWYFTIQLKNAALQNTAGLILGSVQHEQLMHSTVNSGQTNQENVIRTR
jgi:hypothetical protein